MFALIVVILIVALLLGMYFGSSSKKKVTEKEPEDDVPFPQLLKTGIKTFDEHCARAWEGECYAELSSWFIRKIADIDDYEPSEDNLRLLYVCRRNAILCDALARAEMWGDDVKDLQINFWGADVSEPTCRFTDNPLVIPIADYFRNPDVLPCAECCSKGRKYCCMTIINCK